MKETITIIIPTFNEESYIRKTIRKIRDEIESDLLAEIIIADGGSTDNTVNLARKANATVVNCRQKGRAPQMNTGAAKATSEILYFLHADSLPPKGFIQLIVSAVQEGYSAGSFRLKFDSSHRFLKIMAWFTRFKTTLLRFGDQSLFVRRNIFEDIGGFDNNLELMEDQEIVRRLKKKGRFALLPERVTTSARKFESNGPYRLMAIFFLIFLLFYLGFSQKKLKNLYRKLIRNGKL